MIEEAIPHLDGQCSIREIATVEASREVYNEVCRAVGLHRGMNSQHEAYAVIREELDEFWDLVKINPKKLSPEMQQKRIQDLKKELIQTAAMCVRAIVDLNL